MQWHFAAVWDVVADTVPHATALIENGVATDWRTYENRAARLASALVALGVSNGSKVAIYGYNSAAWIEAHYAIFKARAVPVNVNYRYMAHELEYLLENADAEVVFFDAQFADRIDGIRGALPKLKALIAIEDGSGKGLDSVLSFERLIETHQPLAPLPYSGQDLFMLYTGGTTGLPKGVMYEVRAITRLLAKAVLAPYVAALETREDLVEGITKLHAAGNVPVSIPACPLMHGTGLSMGVMTPHAVGGCVAVYRNERLEPDRLLRLVEETKATDLTIVGDAFAKPLVEALKQAESRGSPYDLDSLKRVRSSGVMFSAEAKRALLEFADISIMDSIAASEGSYGVSVTTRKTKPGETGTFQMGPETKVFNDRFEEIEPGSDEIGMIGTATVVPLGYYKDAEKSRATFREINGVRYSFPGDYAKVASDGSLILLGRGSNCINTGGEKVYPEEVEEILKRFPGIVDCLVVGVPDDRFGQKVIGIVEAAGKPVHEDEMAAFARTQLAGYKIPRTILVAERVMRAPNGKADYKWARQFAYDKLGIQT